MRGLGYLAWIPGAPRSELRRLEDAAPLLLEARAAGRELRVVARISLTRHRELDEREVLALVAAATALA